MIIRQTRDEGRSLDYDAKERNAVSVLFYATRMGRGFAGGLSCQAPGEGDQPFTSSPFALPSRKAAVTPAEICSALPWAL